MKCEACEGPLSVKSTLTEEYDGERTSKYVLCANCLLQLVTLSLTKRQFKNLIKNGHSPDEFYLHGDFYSESGEAMQPKLGK
jgi:hypothetical protein